MSILTSIIIDLSPSPSVFSSLHNSIRTNNLIKHFGTNTVAKIMKEGNWECPVVYSLTFCLFNKKLCITNIEWSLQAVAEVHLLSQVSLWSFAKLPVEKFGRSWLRSFSLHASAQTLSIVFKTCLYRSLKKKQWHKTVVSSIHCEVIWVPEMLGNNEIKIKMNPRFHTYSRRPK